MAMGEGGESSLKRGLAQRKFSERKGRNTGDPWLGPQEVKDLGAPPQCKDPYTPEMEGLQRDPETHTRILGEPNDTTIRTLATT